MIKPSTHPSTLTCCTTTLSYIRTKLFAPSQDLLRRVLFLCLTVVLVGSYNPVAANTCTTGSTTGINLGTEPTPSTAAISTTCGTYVQAGVCGPGATFSVTLTANTYYDFNVSTAGGSTTTGNININNTNYTTIPYLGFNPAAATSVTLGTNRTSAIACGSWGPPSSSTLQYRYSTPTAPSLTGTGVGGAVTVCSGYSSPAYSASSSYATGYAWTSAVTGTATATISNAAISNPTVTFNGVGTVVLTCTATNNGKCTNATSTSTITVAAQPSLTSPTPASQTDCNGATPSTLSTTAAGGTGTITYQWYSIGSNANTGGTPISGANSTTYVPPTGTNGTVYYYATMAATGSGCNTATTPLNDAAVIVDAQTSISAQPTSSQTVCKAGAVTLSTTVTGGTGLWTYQWYYNNTTNSNAGGTPITGATSSTYTLSTSNSTTASPGGTNVVGGPYYYYCVITPTGFTNGCNTLTTNVAGVTIVAAPSLTAPTPSTQTDCNGATPTTISTTSSGGTGAITYQWFSNASNSTSGGISISGANALTYAPPTSTNGTVYYYATMTATGSACATATTPSTAQVITDAQPVIYTQPAATQTVCQHSAVTLSSAATNSVSGGTFTYQWYYNGTTNSTSGGAPVTGGGGTVASNTNATYSLVTSNTSTSSPGGTGVAGGPYYYYCVFTPTSGTGCNSVTSNTAGVTVTATPTPTFTTVPSNPICTYVNATYTTQPGQTNYVWSGFGTLGTDYNIQSGSLGTTSNTVTVQWLTSGTKTVTVGYTSSSCPYVTPASNTTTVNASPTPTLSSTGLNCTGSYVTYTTQSGQSGYTWTFSGTSGTDYILTSGTGTSTSYTAQVKWLTSGSKTVTVNYTNSSSCSAPTPGSLTLTINAAPGSASLSDVIDPCNGGHTATVTITGGTSPYTFSLSCGSTYTEPSPYEVDAAGATSCNLYGVVDANSCPFTGLVGGNPVTYPARALTTGGTESCTIGSGATQLFYDGSGNLMAQVVAGSTALGSTSVAVSIDGSVQQTTQTHNQHYEQRHVIITPTTTAASATISLFTTDTEVDALAAASAGDLHTAPAYYGTFPSSTSSSSAFAAGVNVMEYDGGSQSPTSHTSETVIRSVSATHNPTIDGYTYNGVWEVTYSVAGFSGFYMFAANSTGNALPVTLETFTAEPINNKYVQLNWVTAQEINNAGFRIERSADATNYETIGWVEGHGNSTATNEYQYADLTAMPGVVYYYRLKQIDYDGNYAYSNIVSASLIGSKGFTVEGLYPNPANNQVSVGVISNIGTTATVVMTDMLGRVVMNQYWSISVGYNTNVFDVSNIANGTYVVSVSSGDVRTSKQLVITK